MKKILLVVIAIFVVTTGLVFAKQAKTNTAAKQGVKTMDKKVLVAYFSWSGNTKSVAEKIHERVGGDIFRIETAVPYPSDYNETAYGVAKKQHDEGTMPELKDNGNVSNYDVIFVGTPVWWYEMAPAVKTFLTKNNFEGKTVVPFITHGGGGKYTIPEEISKLAKGSKVLEPLVIHNDGGSSADKDIDEWLKDLN